MTDNARLTTRVAWPFSLALALTLPVSVIAYHGLAPLAVILGFLVLAIEVRKGLRPRMINLRPVAPFAALLLWGGLSLAWSNDPGVSAERFPSLVGNFLVGWLVIGTAHRQISSEVNLRSTAFAYLGGILSTLLLMLVHTLSAGAFFEALGFNKPIMDRTMALAATNPAATVVAIFALPGCLLLWRGIGAPVALAVLSACAVVVFLSQSLAANIGFIVAFAVTLAVWCGGRKVLGFLTASMVMVVLLLPALRLANDAPFSYLRVGLSSLGLNLPPSTVHRTYIYDFVLRRIADQPLVGWGLGVSRRLPGGQERIPELDRAFLPLHPHNGILEVWVELGAIGALGLAAFIWKIMAGIMRSINDRATAAVFSGAAASYMVIGLAAYSVWSSWWIAAGVLAAASGTAFLAERELTGGRGSQQIRQGIGN